MQVCDLMADRSGKVQGDLLQRNLFAGEALGTGQTSFDEWNTHGLQQ